MLLACVDCGRHHRVDTECPFCGRAAGGTTLRNTAAAVALGLSSGCFWPTGQADYGISYTPEPTPTEETARTGDTGDSGDTGDTGDSGDTGDGAAR
jgi:hypothetical protein